VRVVARLCVVASLEVARKGGLPEQEAIALGNLGLLHAEEGDRATAVDALSEAIAIFKRIGIGNDHPNLLGFARKLAEMDSGRPPTPS
jgi:hypothetical protein